MRSPGRATASPARNGRRKGNCEADVKLQTFFFLLGGAVLVFVLSLLYTPNSETLNRPIVLTRDFTMPVWAAFLFVALASMAIPLIFGLLRDVKHLFDSITRRRVARTQKEM